MEKHNICLWNNGLNAESDLINFIKKDESLKLISINYYQRKTKLNYVKLYIISLKLILIIKSKDVDLKNL